MSKPFKIEIVHDDSGKIVKRLEYSTDSERYKAYKGVLENLNMADYTANLVDETLTPEPHE